MAAGPVDAELVERVSAFLVGRKRRRTQTFLALAVGIAVFFGVGPLLLDRLSIDVSGTGYFQALLIATFLAAAVNAYSNDGLLVSWIIAAAGLLPFALTFALTDAPIGREPTLVNASRELLGSAGLYGVVVGTVGFVLGAWLRRLFDPIGVDGTDES